MRKGDVVAQVAARCGINQRQAEEAVSAALEQIELALARGEDVQLLGFGSFVRRHRAATTGKNPRSGQPLTIPAHHSVGFRPGKKLRAAIADAAQ